MLLRRTDPFREFDRLTRGLFDDAVHLFDDVTYPATMPMDAYRDGDTFVIHFDVPGVRADSIDLEIERDVLTVKAERPDVSEGGRRMVVAERPSGTFSRQLFLGETLETDNIAADYADGVLTLRVPLAKKAKPRRISISEGSGQAHEINA